MTRFARTSVPVATETLEGIAQTRGILSRLVLFASTILLLGQLVIAWFAEVSFEQELKPQLSEKIKVVGLAVATQIEFAVNELDIPPGELVGMETFLDAILTDNHDIEYLALLDLSSQEVLFKSGRSPEELKRLPSDSLGTDIEVGFITEIAGFTNGTFPIVSDDHTAIALHVGISNEYVRSRLSEILYGVTAIIVISLLVTLEFLIFFMNVQILASLEHIKAGLAEGARGVFSNRWVLLRTHDEIGQLVATFNRVLQGLRQHYDDFRFDMRETRDAQLSKNIAQRIEATCAPIDARYQFTHGTKLLPRNTVQIRIPLFLFIFAEELSRSFLPLFVAEFSPANMAVSNELLISIPLTLFMLAAVIATPFGGRLADRYGARRAFLIGIVPAIIGYIGTFLIDNYVALITWRTLSGLGYGLIFIAAQAWVAENAGKSNRARDMTVFVGAVFAGTICGPSIGSILADSIGFKATFLISAGLAVISGMMVYSMLENTEKGQTTPRGILNGKELQVLFSDPRLFAVTVFAAVPGKFILAGFLFYLVPLYLTELENRQPTIGWMIMLYGVSTIVCMPLASRFADHTGRHVIVVAVGGTIAGLGCFASLFETAIGASNAVMIAIIALGVGHALSLTSQLAIIQDVADRYHKGLGRASTIGTYRLVERAGMVLGPIGAGTLVAYFGYQGAIIGIGGIVLVSTALYGTLMALSPKRIELAEK